MSSTDSVSDHVQTITLPQKTPKSKCLSKLEKHDTNQKQKTTVM